MSGQNYARGVPMGNNQMPFQGNGTPPAVAAIATNVRDSSPNVSSIVVLNQNTTAVEVGATGGNAYIKWLAQSVVDSSVAGTSVIGTGASANFDHVIPPSTYRRFVIPINANNPQGYSSQVGANRENGLYPNMAVAGGGASIIAITQYGSSNSY
jgi:hypothetical protein